MKRAWITNIVLVLLVAGLAVYAIYKPGVDADAARFPLSTTSKSTVDRIAIERKGADRIELRRQGTDWMLERPYTARADRAQIERLLDLLDARSRDKLPATDLQRFDLDAPALKVTFNDATIAFGTTNPMTQEQYVLAGDGVYLIGAQYRSFVPDAAQRLLTHALFRPDEKPVAFVLPGFAVQQRDGKWEMVPLPAGMTAKDRPSQDDYNRWVEDWKLSSSLSTQPAAGAQPSEWIEVKLADGKSLRIGIVRRDPELVLMRADEKLEFFFSGETKAHLLSPPVTARAPETPAGNPTAPAR